MVASEKAARVSSEESPSAMKSIFIFFNYSEAEVYHGYGSRFISHPEENSFAACNFYLAYDPILYAVGKLNKNVRC
jgi:hypothetical protein